MNRIHLNIPSDLVFERVVRASAAELGSTMGFPRERVEDLKLAVSEAVTNAIEHGGGGGVAGSVEVIFSLHADQLEVEIIDHGKGIEHFNTERRVVEEDNLEAGMLRGFGSYLISELVDQYEVQSSGTGTSLRLRIFKAK
ncbi:MAG TPA: ATP-binding protein [Herpetosiphon sp.]|uniref:Anti-sigma regulatory factor, serine/threonine protein kinase n=2 Tax=Herpetosiphon TaxID=64 RepID=A9AWX8_HERA2|nr:ATP-binding protein [Herpetosiphon sp.]ABX03379.1 putative anti-sigma regulatory factor, serine/threonine protein kinase [Herpetosiphon aurantiacus DSM 785]MCA0352118.1 ATP-binding protein [Chloroflexota bacterium]HBW50534.1 ATP-binding protein [Herpetosiphon sp.]